MKSVFLRQKDLIMKKNIFAILLFLIGAITASAQTNQTQSKSSLASSYYSRQQYDKAATLYSELYESTNLTSYLDMYLNCLIELKDYDNAEKVLKKQLRKSENPNYYITLGYIYREMKQPDKATEQYDKALENLAKNNSAVISMSNTFLNRREFEYAAKTFLKGRELIPGEKFRYYLGNVYSYQRDYDKMIDEYLLMVKENEADMGRVTSRIKNLLMYSTEDALLDTFKSKVMKSIQSDPDVFVYTRLLIWIFIEEKNYTNALRQSIALDRRTQTEDRNILTFSSDAAKFEQYDIALEALDYLKQNHKNSPTFNEAEQQYAKTLYQRYCNTDEQLNHNENSINEAFELLIEHQGFQAQTVPSVINYAHFLAFYQNNIAKAEELLEKAMQSRNINSNLQSQLKLELSDIMVYDNNLWEATLLYAQISDANSGNTIGDEAKLKKAKLSYYMGDIFWAQAQVDVLKASTSKLTANDAMEMSLLFSSHFNLDSIVEPLQMYGRADLLIYQNKDSLALMVYDSIATLYPGHTLLVPIIMQKAKICEKHFQYEEAARYYQQILDEYAYSSSADKACFCLAKINQLQFKNIEKAQELYKTILTEYPGSIYVHEARVRFRYLRGDIKEEEMRQMLP